MESLQLEFAAISTMAALGWRCLHCMTCDFKVPIMFFSFLCLLSASYSMIMSSSAPSSWVPAGYLSF